MGILDKSKDQLIKELEELQAKLLLVEASELEARVALIELKGDEEKFRTLYDNAPLPYQSLDFDGCFLDVNPAWLKTLGYKQEEIIGKWYGDFLHPDDKAHFEKNFPAFKKRGYFSDVQFKIRNKKGRYLQISFEGCIGYHPDGSFRQTYCVFQDITERKRIEEQLQRSQDFNQTILNSSPDLIYIYDIVERKNIYSNLGIQRILGYSVEEIHTMGENILPDLMHPDDFKKYLSEIIPRYQTADDEELIEHEYRMRHKNGEWCILHSKETIFKRLEGGEPQQIFGLTSDITEQKLSKTALAHSHELMKYIIEHNRSAVAVHDMDMNYIYVSQRYLKDYNVKEKDVIGKNHYDVFPDLPQKWRDVHQKVLAGEIFSEEDDAYEREDGSVDWTRWECRPWYEEEGTIGGLIVYTEVITEQKQILEALSKEKEFSEKIIKTSSAAIVGLDLNHRIKIFNKGLQDITGYEPSEVIGKDWFDIFFPSDIANEMNNVWKDAWGHSSHSYENLILGKTGEEKFISWQTTGLYDDPDINNHLLISIGEDITDRKQKDIELGKYRESLEDLVKERTIDLKNSQEALLNLVDDLNKESNELDKTNKQLIRLNEELEKFTYSVSHDLKAPLRGIDGYSQLLLDDFGNDLPQGAQEFLANIRKDTEQMNLLIEDLLAYSRMELKDFFLENINLNSLIDRNVSSFSKIFSSENFQIKLTIPNEFIITADKEGLNLILRNLIDNAIKFTSNRKNSSIEIGANETKTHWLIYVKDNGIGFDMIYHDKIYQIFQRLHLAEEYQGTGVGLAMVSKAINRMNGKIWAESSPNKGASFYIEIEKKI